MLNLNPIVQTDLIQQNYLITKHTKILDTQYRITHRFYHTQNQLFKWQLSAGSECIHCGQIDSLEHHFVLCERKKIFWETLKIWKRQITNIDVNETSTDILIGIHNPNNDLIISFLNFINLCAKTYMGK